MIKSKVKKVNKKNVKKVLTKKKVNPKQKSKIKATAKVKSKDKTKIKVKVKAKAKAKARIIIKTKVRTPQGKLIGRITHYYANIDVAVISLTSPLKIKEKIRVIGGQETDFEQKIDSMQVEHKEVKIGKKGDSVGIKIKEKVHDGYKVYKI